MNLPLSLPGVDKDSIKVVAIGMDRNAFTGQNWSRVKILSLGEARAGELPSLPSNADAAIIRVTVTNQGSDQRFGGAVPDELNFLSFSSMAKSKSWRVTPSLEVIQHVMKFMGARTIIAIDFRQPYVLDKASGILNAGALFATFGVRDEALLDIVFGAFDPTGKLPYALANSEEAIIKQAPDAPGYPKRRYLVSFWVWAWLLTRITTETILKSEDAGSPRNVIRNISYTNMEYIN
jgi:beta-glucosidase